VHEADKESTIQAIADLRTGKVKDMVNFENRHLRKDGTIATLLWSVHLDPKESLIYAIARDAHDIKQAEEKIKNNEKRFRALVQNSTDGFCLLEADGTIIERSLSAKKILGQEADQVPGKIRFDLVHADDLAAVHEVWRQVQTNPGAIHTIACRYQMPDGSYKWLETTCHNQLQEPNIGALVVNFRDITASKTAEIALKASEARLKEAQAIGHIGNWEMDLVHGTTVWSDETYRIFGLEIEAITPSFEASESFIHPEDRVGVLTRFEKGQAALENGFMSFRIVRRDGEVRYVYSDWNYEFDDKGRLFRVFGVLQDVTGRKLAEIEVEKSEEKYRNLFKLSPIPMWVYDVETLHFLDVNEAAIQHYGYSKDEFLAMTWKDIRPQENVRKLEEIASTLQRSRVHYHFITRHVKKSGEVMDVDINNSFVDLGGKGTRLVIATDISERLKYIGAIKAQNVKLREIAWIQSHVVRAPLARMMGLINLVNDYPPETIRTTDILSYLSASAHELDNIVREVVKKAEQIKDQPLFEEQP
jgi:PAS domain S-box-containing protein